jgi:hypothetical protein
MSSVSQERKRIVDRISNLILGYETSSIELQSFTRELKSLINDLDQFSDPEWISEIRWFWMQIEIVNASQLSNAHSTIDSMDQTQINGSLRSIEQLLIADR